MKKSRFLKKIIACFALFVTLFAFSGCNKESEPEPETQEAMFAKYMTAQSNLSDPTKGYKAVTRTTASAFGFSETTTANATVNFATGELAYIEKDSTGDVVEEYYVVKNNDKTIFYHHEKDDSFGEVEDYYNAMYVGSDFIYRYGDGELVEAPTVEATTFEEFKNAFIEAYSGTVEEEMDLGEGSAFTVEKFEFSQVDNEYEFTTKFKASVEGFTISAEIGISFSETIIKSLIIRMDMSLMTMTSTTNFYSGYDSSLMPTTFNKYPSLNEIENAEFTVTYYMDGVTSGWLNTYYDEYKPGQTFTFDADELEYIMLDNTTIDGWYLDPECTISIDTLTEYPSYDIELYAKTVPNTGYAVVVYTATIKEEGNLIYWPESDTFVYDVTQTQSINIADFVDDPDATITEVKVNGTVVSNNTLVLASGGYYIVEINGTTPGTDW